MPPQRPEPASAAFAAADLDEAVRAMVGILRAERPQVVVTYGGYGHPDHIPSPHPGEFALPGGQADRWEAVSAVARRRLVEQLGMRLPPESVLGLHDDYVTPATLVITPVVLWTSEPARAADVIAVPFTDLDVEPAFVASAESERPAIRLPLHGGWLHAPTAAVLHQFREVVLRRRRTWVAAS